jgi:hypothetical protein
MSFKHVTLHMENIGSVTFATNQRLNVNTKDKLFNLKLK